MKTYTEEQKQAAIRLLRDIVHSGALVNPALLHKAEAILGPHRYAVYPGFVISNSDGQRHYISFKRLCELYQLNPAECIDATWEGQVRGRDLSQFTHIYTRADGKYPLFSKPA